MRFSFYVCLGLATIGLAGEGFGTGRAYAGLTGYTVSGGFAANETGGPFDSGTTLVTTGSTTFPGTIVQVPM
jgi:hypothetical protein